MYENTHKELPYTVELDWQTGNIFLNIPSIDSKLVIDKKNFDSIKSTISMSNNRNLLRTIKAGDTFCIGNVDVIYKILDVTSLSYFKFDENIEVSKEVIDYVESGVHLGVNVCVNHSKEETHVFIIDAGTCELIKGCFVVSAMLINGEVDKIIAKSFKEINKLDDDGNFIYKRC